MQILPGVPSLLTGRVEVLGGALLAQWVQRHLDLQDLGHPVLGLARGQGRAQGHRGHVRLGGAPLAQALGH